MVVVSRAWKGSTPPLGRKKNRLKQKTARGGKINRKKGKKFGLTKNRKQKKKKMVMNWRGKIWLRKEKRERKLGWCKNEDYSKLNKKKRRKKLSLK